jgi:hypothetical protein
MSFFSKVEVDDSYPTILLNNVPGSNIVMGYSMRMNLGHLLHDACPEGETIVSYISSPTKLHRNHMIHNAYLWVRVKLANDFRDDPQSSRTKRAHVPRRKNKPYK